MTQPNKPGPSWEKHPTVAANEYYAKHEMPVFVADEPGRQVAIEKAFAAGVAWAQEKAAAPTNELLKSTNISSYAPGEESWEKIRDTYLEEEGYEFLGRFGSKQYDDARTIFDAAVNLIALPLRAELKIQDDANDILTRQCDELKAEAASLRAENAKLQKNWLHQHTRVNAQICEADALRAQLAEFRSMLSLVNRIHEDLKPKSITWPGYIGLLVGSLLDRTNSQEAWTELKAGRKEG